MPGKYSIQIIKQGPFFPASTKATFRLFFLPKDAKEVLMQPTFLQHNLKDLLL